LALDAERRLPLRAGERPKEKRRIDGRSGDQAEALMVAFVVGERVART